MRLLIKSLFAILWFTWPISPGQTQADDSVIVVAKVTDATTGEPIGKFLALPGFDFIKVSCVDIHINPGAMLLILARILAQAVS